MKSTALFVMVLILGVSSVLAGDITLEAVAGLGSPCTPFSSEWKGAFNSDGLYHREFAFRSSYKLNEWLSLSGMVGWLKNREITRQFVYFDDLSPLPSHQDVTYFIPSARLSYKIIRVDLGAVIYTEDLSGSPYNPFDYPFNGSHRFKPSIGLELGEQAPYIFIRTLDSFPLYSGGLASVGVGGRIGGLYEQQLAVIAGPYELTGIGYRGEFRVYHQTAVSAGLSLAGTNDNKNVILLSFGLKTVLK